MGHIRRSKVMAKLINEFSWSHSRRNAFEECMRKYYYSYYGSWNGWERDATDRQKELYLHNKLINRWMWLGKLVHESIKTILALVHRGAPCKIWNFTRTCYPRGCGVSSRIPSRAKSFSAPAKSLA